MSNPHPYQNVRAHDLLWSIGVRNRSVLREAVLNSSLTELWNKKREETPIDERLLRARNDRDLTWIVANWATDARSSSHPSKLFPLMYYEGNRDLLLEEKAGIVYESFNLRRTKSKHGQSNIGLIAEEQSQENSLAFQQSWIQHSLDGPRVNVIMLDESTARLLSGLPVNYSRTIGIMPHGFSSNPGEHNNPSLARLRSGVRREGLVLSPFPVVAGSTIIPEGYLLIEELSDYINVVQMSSNYPARHVIELSKKPLKRFRPQHTKT